MDSCKDDEINVVPISVQWYKVPDSSAVQSIHYPCYKMVTKKKVCQRPWKDTFFAASVIEHFLYEKTGKCPQQL